MSYKPSKIVSNAKQMKKNGLVYGYGYKYEKITNDNIKAKAKMFAYTSDQIRLMKKKIGKMGIDCSGFVNRAAGTNLGGSTDIKNSSPATYPISNTTHRKNGMFIWKSGHVALIYSEFGKWYIIEAQSTATDLVITEWSKRASAFTCYGKIKGVSYDSETISYKKYSEADFIHDMRKALDLKDSASRHDILNNTPTVSLTKNRYAQCISCLEKRLISLGYYSGVVESDQGRSPIYGDKLALAVKKYEKKVSLKATPEKANGELEAKGATWRSLLGI
jgi:hypothetical protein